MKFHLNLKIIILTIIIGIILIMPLFRFNITGENLSYFYKILNDTKINENLGIKFDNISFGFGKFMLSINVQISNLIVTDSANNEQLCKLKKIKVKKMLYSFFLDRFTTLELAFYNSEISTDNIEKIIKRLPETKSETTKLFKVKLNNIKINNSKELNRSIYINNLEFLPQSYSEFNILMTVNKKFSNIFVRKPTSEYIININNFDLGSILYFFGSNEITFETKNIFIKLHEDYIDKNTKFNASFTDINLKENSLWRETKKFKSLSFDIDINENNIFLKKGIIQDINNDEFDFKCSYNFLKKEFKSLIFNKTSIAKNELISYLIINNDDLKNFLLKKINKNTSIESGSSINIDLIQDKTKKQMVEKIKININVKDIGFIQDENLTYFSDKVIINWKTDQPVSINGKNLTLLSKNSNKIHLNMRDLKILYNGYTDTTSIYGEYAAQFQNFQHVLAFINEQFNKKKSKENAKLIDFVKEEDTEVLLKFRLLIIDDIKNNKTKEDLVFLLNLENKYPFSFKKNIYHEFIKDEKLLNYTDNIKFNQIFLSYDNGNINLMSKINGNEFSNIKLGEILLFTKYNQNIVKEFEISKLFDIETLMAKKMEKNYQEMKQMTHICESNLEPKKQNTIKELINTIYIKPLHTNNNSAIQKIIGTIAYNLKTKEISGISVISGNLMHHKNYIPIENHSTNHNENVHLKLLFNIERNNEINFNQIFLQSNILNIKGFGKLSLKDSNVNLKLDMENNGLKNSELIINYDYKMPIRSLLIKGDVLKLDFTDIIKNITHNFNKQNDSYNWRNHYNLYLDLKIKDLILSENIKYQDCLIKYTYNKPNNDSFFINLNTPKAELILFYNDTILSMTTDNITDIFYLDSIIENKKNFKGKYMQIKFDRTKKYGKNYVFLNQADIKNSRILNSLIRIVSLNPDIRNIISLITLKDTIHFNKSKCDLEYDSGNKIIQLSKCYAKGDLIDIQGAGDINLKTKEIHFKGNIGAHSIFSNIMELFYNAFGKTYINSSKFFPFNINYKLDF